jgi:CheY-like chemotaxis protein
MLTIPTYTAPIANILNGVTEAAKTEGAEIGFIAPEAKILVVDDIESNLEVARGLLGLYQIKIDTAAGGKEAIEKARKTAYDIIFMDHMMPGMDGIEAAAAIRALGIQDVPIVALTANAISGMREMFLENGFNDYLSKPIDIHSLDEIMARWVPPEKRVKTGIGIKRKVSGGKTALRIPGVDTAKGLAMTGGAEAGYRKVLAQFRKDAEERLPVFAAFAVFPEETALAAFASQAHAIKSAAGTIGAAEVSAEAAVLEAAGKAGDLKAIGETLPGFREHLAELVRGIERALEDRGAEKDGGNAAGRAESAEAGGETREAVLAAFSALRAALEAKDMKEIDRLLAELDKTAADAETRERIDAVSDKVLMGEYREAVDELDRLSANGEA